MFVCFQLDLFVVCFLIKVLWYNYSIFAILQYEQYKQKNIFLFLDFYVITVNMPKLEIGIQKPFDLQTNDSWKWNGQSKPDRKLNGCSGFKSGKQVMV
jgi:hypothetical protein